MEDNVNEYINLETRKELYEEEVLTSTSDIIKDKAKAITRRKQDYKTKVKRKDAIVNPKSKNRYEVVEKGDSFYIKTSGGSEKKIKHERTKKARSEAKKIILSDMLIFKY